MLLPDSKSMIGEVQGFVGRNNSGEQWEGTMEHKQGRSNKYHWLLVGYPHEVAGVSPLDSLNHREFTQWKEILLFVAMVRIDKESIWDCSSDPLTHVLNRMNRIYSVRPSTSNVVNLVF